MEVEEINQQKFWQKVDKQENDCWEWQASLRAGYGAFKVNGKVESAHRVAYVIENGEQPENLVLHECDNRKCVNPNHLYSGTYSDNLQDRIERTDWQPIDNVPKGEEQHDSKLTESDVKEIKKRYEHKNQTQKEIAQDFPVCRQHISDVVNGKRWAHLE